MLTVNAVEVQKHRLKGPVGYTVVGSPTIVDGIASGFSNSNYLAVSSNTPTINKLEFSGKISNWSSQSTNQVIYRDSGTYFIVRLYNGQFQCLYWNGTQPALNYSLDSFVSTNLYFKIILMEGNQTLYLSDNGNDWDLVDSKSLIGLSYPTLGTATIGANPHQPVQTFTGSIDLNQTYIKVNGKLWFYQPADTKYIVKDGKLVWADPNIYLRDISSTGASAGNTFYIDTGFTPTNKTTFEIEMARESVTGVSQTNSSPFYVGGGTVDDVTYNPYGFNLQNSNRFFYFSSTEQVGTMSYETFMNGKKKVWKSQLTDSNYTINTYENGTLLDTLTFSTVTDQSARSTLYLGCQNLYINGAPRPYYSFVGKIYYAKFYEDGVLIRHFVPVKQGVLPSITADGMFDIVNQQFYANKGTGVFTIGRDE